jgi:hypothetical protein
MAGGYFGFALRFLADLAIEAPRDRVIRSALAIVGAVVVSVGGLRIERACEVPEHDDEDSDPA